MAPQTDSSSDRQALIASLEPGTSVGRVVGSAEGFLVPLGATQLSLATQAINKAISARDSSA
jgi:hypothetical protein